MGTSAATSGRDERMRRDTPSLATVSHTTDSQNSDRLPGLHHLFAAGAPAMGFCLVSVSCLFTRLNQC